MLKKTKKKEVRHAQIRIDPELKKRIADASRHQKISQQEFIKRSVEDAAANVEMKLRPSVVDLSGVRGEEKLLAEFLVEIMRMSDASHWLRSAVDVLRQYKSIFDERSAERKKS